MRDLSIHSGIEELREECPRIHNQDQVQWEFWWNFKLIGAFIDKIEH